MYVCAYMPACELFYKNYSAVRWAGNMKSNAESINHEQRFQQRLQLITAARCTSSGTLAGISLYARAWFGLKGFSGLRGVLFLNVSRGYSCCCCVVLLHISPPPYWQVKNNSSRFVGPLLLCPLSPDTSSAPRSARLERTVGFLEWAKITKRLLEN